MIPDALLSLLDEERRAAFWRDMLTRGDLPLVAELQGTLVGFVIFGSSAPDHGDGHTSEVYALNVDPDRWRRGVGRALLTAATEVLGERGSTDAVLWVLTDNARARRFYERQGWTPDGATRVERFGDADLEEVRYRIDLASRPGGRGRRRT